MRLRYFLIIILLFICNAGDTSAGSVDIPNNFAASGAPAMAADVHSNFSAVEAAVNDNDRRIVALESAIATLQSRISSFQITGDADQTTVRKLQSTVDSLQKTVNSQQATITALQSTIDSFQGKNKTQQETIADLTKRLDAFEKKSIHNVD